MSGRYHPWWLRHLLAGVVVLPAAGVLGAAVYSVQLTAEWETSTNDAPGFGLCGMFVLVPLTFGVILLAAKAFHRRDPEMYQGIAGVCGLGAVLLTIALADAAAVGLGLREGQVPVPVLVAVTVGWAYFVAVGLGHWHLARVFQAAAGCGPSSRA